MVALEEENQEIFNTATTSEEELDAVNGRLYAATNSLATAELRVHDLEHRLQEALAAGPQRSEVCLCTPHPPAWVAPTLHSRNAHFLVYLTPEICVSQVANSFHSALLQRKNWIDLSGQTSCSVCREGVLQVQHPPST